jgi:SAM-dependent methyltransferase
LEYTNPLPTNEELEEFYNKYDDVRANQEVVLLNVKRNIRLISKYIDLKDSSLVLDFGCGNGEFVEEFGGNCYGIDIVNKKKSSRISTSFKNLENKKYDCITLFGVLEHLNDVRNTMEKLNGYLSENGCFVITTVNAEGVIPYYYKPPEHLTYWTKESIYKLAEFLGCGIVYYEPYSMYQLGAVYLDRLLSRTPENLKNIIIKNTKDEFPKVVDVPTNEVLVIMKRKNDGCVKSCE